MYQGKFGSLAASPASQKPQASVGTIIFYTLYVFFILLFCLSAFLGLRHLNGWLVEFEAAQPDIQAKALYHIYFQDPDWESLYSAAGFRDSEFENSASFASYMDQRQNGQPLTYSPIGNDAGDKTYLLQLDGETIGSFTMKNRNHSEDSPFTIPDWQFHHFELFALRDQGYQIQVPQGYTVQVNGVALTEDHLVQVTSPIAVNHLPVTAEVTRTLTYRIDGLFCPPEVTVMDRSGTTAELSYDEEAQHFLLGSSEPIPDQFQVTAEAAARQHLLWLAGLNGEPAMLKKHFDEHSQVYAALTAVPVEPRKAEAYDFSDAVLSQYQTFGEDFFSLRVELTLDLAEETIPYQQSLIFQKTGKVWRCIFASPEDLTRPQGRVRLSFFQDETPVSSDFFHSNPTEIITPVISAPEGQVFAGWVDAQGNLILQPDSTGRAAIPEGQTLAPMTLYAHYEMLGGN